MSYVSGQPLGSVWYIQLNINPRGSNMKSSNSIIPCFICIANGTYVAYQGIHYLNFSTGTYINIGFMYYARYPGNLVFYASTITFVAGELYYISSFDYTATRIA